MARGVANDQAQRAPPETPGRLQQSLINHLNRLNWTRMMAEEQTLLLPQR